MQYMQNIKSTFILLFSVLFSLNTAAQSFKAVPFDRLEAKNEVYYFMNKPFTGRSLDRYDNKKRKQILNWKNGLLHGKRTSYFKSGRIKDVFYFSEGKRTDSFYIYDDFSTLREKGYYKNGLLNGLFQRYYRTGMPYIKSHYKNGVLDGMMTLYYNNGQKESEAMMKNNKKNGVFNAWYEEGTKRKIAFYKEGKREGELINFYPNGDTALIENIKDGKRHGIYKIWDATLKVLIKYEEYKDGKKDGLSLSFDQFGDTLFERNYTNNMLDGDFKSYESGELESWGKYEEGKKVGYWHEGWASHYKQREGNYTSGTMTGEWLFYDTEGNKLFCSIFNDEGEVTKTKKFKRRK